MIMMKQIILFLFITIKLVVFAQTQPNKYNYTLIDGVEINVIEEDCIDEKYGIEKRNLIIELNNLNNYPVTISFKKEIWYDDKCQSCQLNSDEYLVNQMLLKKTTIIGGCKSDNKSLNIFVKMLNLDNVRQLTKYELKDIKVEKVN